MQVIQNQTFQVDGLHTQKIHLDQLTPSIYVLKISIGEHTKTFKIIKL